MGDEAGNFVPQGLGRDQGDLFDDPLVSVEIERQLSVVPEMVDNIQIRYYLITFKRSVKYFALSRKSFDKP